MRSTLVVQSHTDPLPHAWLKPCLQSVEQWAQEQGFDYRFIGDELFDGLSAQERNACGEQTVVASDLARLLSLKRALLEGYTQVVWCDADTFVIAPSRLTLTTCLPPDATFAVGREVWVQTQGRRLRSFVKVHNAFLFVKHNNPFLDYYLYCARQMVTQYQRGDGQKTVVPQLIGPKLLTALHNVSPLPVAEPFAVLAPEVIVEIIAQVSGPALSLFNRRSRSAPLAVNLCASSIVRGELTNKQMALVIEQLPKSTRLFVPS